MIGQEQSYTHKVVNQYIFAISTPHFSLQQISFATSALLVRMYQAEHHEQTVKLMVATKLHLACLPFLAKQIQELQEYGMDQAFLRQEMLIAGIKLTAVTISHSNSIKQADSFIILLQKLMGFHYSLDIVRWSIQILVGVMDLKNFVHINYKLLEHETFQAFFLAAIKLWDGEGLNETIIYLLYSFICKMKTAQLPQPINQASLAFYFQAIESYLMTSDKKVCSRTYLYQSLILLIEIGQICYKGVHKIVSTRFNLSSEQEKKQILKIYGYLCSSDFVVQKVIEHSNIIPYILQYLKMGLRKIQQNQFSGNCVFILSKVLAGASKQQKKFMNKFPDFFNQLKEIFDKNSGAIQLKQILFGICRLLESCSFWVFEAVHYSQFMLSLANIIVSMDKSCLQYQFLKTYLNGISMYIKIVSCFVGRYEIKSNQSAALLQSLEFVCPFLESTPAIMKLKQISEVLRSMKFDEEMMKLKIK